MVHLLAISVIYSYNHYNYTYTYIIHVIIKLLNKGKTCELLEEIPFLKVIFHAHNMLYAYNNAYFIDYTTTYTKLIRNKSC